MGDALHFLTAVFHQQGATAESAEVNAMSIGVLGTTNVDIDIAKPVVLIADGGTIGHTGHEYPGKALHRLAHLGGIGAFSHHDVDIVVRWHKVSIADDAKQRAIAQPPADAGGVECLPKIAQVPERLRGRELHAVLDGAETLALRFGNVVLLGEAAGVGPVAGFRGAAHMASSRTRAAMRLMISLDDRPLR